MGKTLAGHPTRLSVRELAGSGDRIALFTLPFLVVGLLLNLAYPAVFSVGGPATVLLAVSSVVLAIGVTVWAWSAILILTRAARRQLITTGPYALVKHPLYTAVALLVLPWLGFVLDSWLGAVVGVVMYVAARRFAPAEEASLAKTFGHAWTAYTSTVKLPWL